MQMLAYVLFPLIPVTNVQNPLLQIHACEIFALNKKSVIMKRHVQGQDRQTDRQKRCASIAELQSFHIVCA